MENQVVVSEVENTKVELPTVTTPEQMVHYFKYSINSIAPWGSLCEQTKNIIALRGSRSLKQFVALVRGYNAKMIELQKLADANKTGVKYPKISSLTIGTGKGAIKMPLKDIIVNLKLEGVVLEELTF